jgi:glycerol-3-phosphate dehydrogenase (NAD(P)+)
VRKLQSEVAEGVFTATAANLLCQKLKLELPIIAAVAAIVEGRLSAQDAVKKLLEIPVGPEIPWIQ